MGIWQPPQVSSNMGIDQLRNLVAILIKDIDFIINGNIDSRNTREIGGWRVGLKELLSKDKDVGMSTADVGVDPVRFFASPLEDGTWKFYVTKSGKLYAVDGYLQGTIEALAGHIGGFTIEADKLSSDSGDGIIEGGTLRTAAPGSKRIEISENQLRTYNDTNQLLGLVLGPSDAGYTYGDMFLYDNGIKVLEFYNRLLGNGYTIRPSNGASLHIGSSDTNQNANGYWKFTGNAQFVNTIDGKAAQADYATRAGSAASSDTLAPSGVVPWGQVDKSGSSITDLTTRNLSDLSQSSSHRTVTDGEKTTWNSKASTSYVDDSVATKADAAQEGWSNITLLNGWGNYGGSYATASYYKSSISVTRVRGVISGGTTAFGTVLFTLPVGYRPASYLLKPVMSFNGTSYNAGTLEIRSDGNVCVGANIGNGLLTIDCEFRAEI